METKWCTIGKHECQIGEFGKNSSRADGLANTCRACKKKYNASYYVKNKDRYNPTRYALRSLQRRKLQDWLLAYLGVHPCVDCGEADVVVLQFDHQRDKLSDISLLVNQVSSITKLEAEVAKCEVVCANDHQRRTAKQFGWYKLLKH